jgi:hypothetical protein
MEAASEPLWAPALIVCMSVSLAVFVAALFAARAGEAHQEDPSARACQSQADYSVACK